MPSSEPGGGIVPDPAFTQTSWDVVSRACRGEAAARDSIARRYWYPLYAYLRRKGQSPQDASDLVQGFLGKLFAQERLGEPDAKRGRFRTFLLVRLDSFVRDHWRRTQGSIKSGGRISFESFDSGTAEERYAREETADTRAEALYDRVWAIGILREAKESLRLERESRGKGRLFGMLAGVLDNENLEMSYTSVAKATGLSEGAIKQEVLRLRKAYIRRIKDLLAGERAWHGPVDTETEVREFYAALYP